jgi:hypothetical protein
VAKLQKSIEATMVRCAYIGSHHISVEPRVGESHDILIGEQHDESSNAKSGSSGTRSERTNLERET